MANKYISCRRQMNWVSVSSRKRISIVPRWCSCIFSLEIAIRGDLILPLYHDAFMPLRTLWHQTVSSRIICVLWLPWRMHKCDWPLSGYNLTTFNFLDWKAHFFLKKIHFFGSRNCVFLPWKHKATGNCPWKCSHTLLCCSSIDRCETNYIQLSST